MPTSIVKHIFLFFLVGLAYLLIPDLSLWAVLALIALLYLILMLSNTIFSRHKEYVPLAKLEQELDLDEDDRLLLEVVEAMREKDRQMANKTLAQWIWPAKPVKVADYQITGGFFYLGEKIDALDNYATEASLVDKTLPVEPANLDFVDDSITFSPQYSDFSPQARGAYLAWLASQRDDPNVASSMVWLYFYGLERRVMRDGYRNEAVNDTEFHALFGEIQRLQRSYAKYQEFFNQASHLLEVMSLIRPEVVKLPHTAIILNANSLSLRYQLAKTVDAGTPIPPELAFFWLQDHPEYTPRTPARRCPQEFARLYKIRYTEQFGGKGLKLRPNKTRLQFNYIPASQSLVTVQLKFDLPDPSWLKAPITKCIAVADRCADELDAYSRYLGRSGTAKTDTAALLLLPDALFDPGTSPVLQQFKQWADAKLRETSGLVSVADFWTHMSTSLPERLHKKDSERMNSLAAKIGYRVVPDPNIHHEKPHVTGYLVLFSSGDAELLKPSAEFNQVVMAIRMGAMVACSDNHIDDSEIQILQQLIDRNAKLSPLEQRSLHAYLLWCLNTPASHVGLKARLAKLSAAEKTAISQMLVRISVTDGNIAVSEINQLEKLYTVLGLDKAAVSSDVHTFAATQRPAHIAQDDAQPAAADAGGFKLNQNLLTQHELDTVMVQNMLSSIFMSDEEQYAKQDATQADVGDKTDTTEPPASHPHTPSAPTLNAVHNGLDAQHQALFAWLLTQDQWTRQAVQAACEKHQLMVDGAIETINDWAYDRVDAPVLEDDDDDIYIDREIVAELDNMKG